MACGAAARLPGTARSWPRSIATTSLASSRQPWPRIPSTPARSRPSPSSSRSRPAIPTEMTPAPDHGEESYRGSGRLQGRAAIITGGDSGIGRAVAIAFAREGADVLIAYLERGRRRPRRPRRWFERPGRSASPSPATSPTRRTAAARRARRRRVRPPRHPGQQRRLPAHLREDRGHHRRGVGPHVPHQHLRHVLPVPGGGAAHEAGRLDHQHDLDPVERPVAPAAAYAATKGAISNFTAGLAQMLADRGIRVNAVAPGPIWTPLIPSTMPAEKAASLRQQAPLGRAGQPKELAPAFVLLASDEGSYITGAVCRSPAGGRCCSPGARRNVRTGRAGTCPTRPSP